MSEEDVDRWARDARDKGVHLSPSCSSFEVLDPHDPILSRQATLLFRRTNEYLQGEMASSQEHYILLEEINRMAVTMYADLRSLTVNLSKTLSGYNEMYDALIKPLLMQIDQIDAQVSRIEVNAYHLDTYTKQLKARFKELEKQK